MQHNMQNSLVNVQIFTKKEDVPLDARILETVEGALRELMVIRNPELKSASPQIIEERLATYLREKGEIETVYAYYPWKNLAIHMVGEEVYFELRTARNKNIITKEEQEKYRNMNVGIVGISIGFNILSALAFSGGPKRLRISDNDIIEITNLNRLRAPLWAVGMNKAIFAAQQILELDPFTELDLWPQGVTKDTLEEYVLKEPKLNIFVDEMDSIDLKILSRLVCRQHGIPVLMATNNADNVILDVERFDQEPEREVLHGLAKDISPEDLKGISYLEWVKIANKIVNEKNLTERMRECIKEIGKTIAAVPQLGTTATIGGAAIAYVIRKIAIGEPMPSGRYVISLDRSIKRDKQAFWKQLNPLLQG